MTMSEELLVEKYFNEMKKEYPDLEEEIIDITCKQAVREGIRDSSIIWEWLQHEV